MSDQASITSHEVEEIVLSSTALLSGAACIFVIFIYSMIHKLKDPFQKLIFFIGVSDLLYSTCKSHLAFVMRLFFDPGSDTNWCIVQGSLQQYGFNVSTLLIFFAALSLYLSVTSNTFHIETYIYPFILTSLILPAIVTIWFIANDAIGNTGLWCFAKMDEYYWQVTLFIHGLYAIPMIFTLILNIKTQLLIKNSSDEGKKKVYNKIKWFPLLQLCFAPIIALRQLNYHLSCLFKSEDGTLLFALLLIAGAFACLNGFLNGIAYAWNKVTRDKVYSYFKGDQKIELKQAFMKNS